LVVVVAWRLLVVVVLLLVVLLGLCDGIDSDAIQISIILVAHLSI